MKKKKLSIRSCNVRTCCSSKDDKVVNNLKCIEGGCVERYDSKIIEDDDITISDAHVIYPINYPKYPIIEDDILTNKDTDYKLAYVAESSGMLSVGKATPVHEFQFNDVNGYVGHINFINGKMVFKGNVEKSAKIFFDYLCDNFGFSKDNIKEKRQINYSLINTSIKPPIEVINEGGIRISSPDNFKVYDTFKKIEHLEKKAHESKSL